MKIRASLPQLLVFLASFLVIIVFGAKAPVYGDDTLDPLRVPLEYFRGNYVVPYFPPLSIFAYLAIYALVGSGPIVMYALIFINATLVSIVIAHAWQRVHWLAFVPLTLPIVPFLTGSPYLIAGLAIFFSYFAIHRFVSGDEDLGFLLSILAAYTRVEIALVSIFFTLVWLSRKQYKKLAWALLLAPLALFVYSYTSVWLHPRFETEVLHEASIPIHILRAFGAGILAVSVSWLSTLPFFFMTVFAIIGSAFSYVGGIYVKQYAIAPFLALPFFHRLRGWQSLTLFLVIFSANMLLVYAPPWSPLYEVFFFIHNQYVQRYDVEIAAFARGVYPSTVALTSESTAIVLADGPVNVRCVVIPTPQGLSCNYPFIRDADYIVCDRYVRAACGCDWGEPILRYDGIVIVKKERGVTPSPTSSPTPRTP